MAFRHDGYNSSRLGSDRPAAADYERGIFPMPAIPAASIHDVDLSLIRQAFPIEAKEIERLGGMLIHGTETEDEFLRLCQLLHDVGLCDKSEGLLRCSAADRDAIHRQYTRLHGTSAQDHFDLATSAFVSQFGVVLVRKSSSRYLNVIYDCTPSRLTDGISEKLRGLFLSRPEVEIMYYGPDEIVADVSETTDAPDQRGHVHAVLLTFSHGVWICDDRRFDDAAYAYTIGHFDEAFTIFSELTALGHPAATAYLAQLYFRGEGVPANTLYGLELLRRAASLGNSGAAFNLGALHRSGDYGVTRDIETSRMYFILARQLGCTLRIEDYLE